MQEMLENYTIDYTLSDILEMMDNVSYVNLYRATPYNMRTASSGERESKYFYNFTENAPGDLLRSTLKNMLLEPPKTMRDSDVNIFKLTLEDASYHNKCKTITHNGDGIFDNYEFSYCDGRVYSIIFNFPNKDCDAICREFYYDFDHIVNISHHHSESLDFETDTADSLVSV